MELPTPASKPQQPIKKLTAAEMQLRREKGLCFPCDEKFTWNHKCPNRQLMILQVDDDDMLPDSSPIDNNLSDPTSAVDDSPTFYRVWFRSFLTSHLLKDRLISLRNDRWQRTGKTDTSFYLVCFLPLVLPFPCLIDMGDWLSLWMMPKQSSLSELSAEGN